MRTAVRMVPADVGSPWLCETVHEAGWRVFSSKLSVTDGDMAVEVVNDCPRVDPL